MPELHFAILAATPNNSSVAPQIDFQLCLTRANADREPDVALRTVALRAMVRIEPTRRRYTDEHREKLADLFGEPKLWSQTVRSMLWTQTSVLVPPFDHDLTIDLPVPCTFDFNVAATKYFHALDEGGVPLSFLFSGTIFYTLPDRRLQVAQIGWDKEAAYRLPVAVWKEMMDRHYPDSTWLNIPRGLFDRLLQHKTRLGLPTFEQALESLLDSEQPVTP